MVNNVILFFSNHLLGVIIFSSIRFLSKKIIKLKFFFLKKKPKPGQTDRFRFGSVRFFQGKNLFNLVWLGFFRFWLGFFRFGSVFSVWLGFGSVFQVWLGFGSVFFRFFVGFGSVRFGFFGFLFIKTKPNRTGRFFQKFNRFNRFFFSVWFFWLFFFRFSQFNQFSGFFAHPYYLRLSLYQIHINKYFLYASD